MSELSETQDYFLGELAALRAEAAGLREALTVISRGTVDGLDGARDSAVLGRAIGVAQRALKAWPEKRTPVKARGGRRAGGPGRAAV